MLLYVRKHRRPGRDERQTLILKTQILGARAASHRLGTAALDVGRGRRQRRDAPIGGVGDDGGAERLDGARAELAVDRVVGAGAGVLPRGVGWRLLVAFSDLTLPLRSLLGGEEGLVLQPQRAFERRGSGRVPDSFEARTRIGNGLTTRGGRANQRQPDQ